MCIKFLIFEIFLYLLGGVEIYTLCIYQLRLAESALSIYINSMYNKWNIY